MAASVASRRAMISTLAVTAAAVLIALVASRPGSPFTPPLFPGAGAPSWLVRPGTALGFDRLSRDGLAVVGAAALFAAVIAFLWALRAAWRGEITVRRVIFVGLLLHVLAVAIPLFLSRDVYSYGIYGRMVSRLGANPYATIPAAFFDDPSYRLVSVDWIDSTSVYGPAFTAVSAALTRLVSSPAVTVLAFKVLAAAASVGTMLLVVVAARRTIPSRAAFAAALIGWNPVVVFHSVAGGHNDTLLGFVVAAGVVLMLASKPARATAALALGTLVKVSGAIPLIVAAAGAVFRHPAGGRARELAIHAGVAVGV
ncbi:MAG TPA: polyprenol phosphomannose-dependent alpha 1,6 mannosyltransferase MptB, partial [Actinomycetota bacterium]|nr:polyprenol phosphomannose-dependent alpha 1,6 mannosyltransferase MptB [Actinomycetota bacterium]